MVGGQVGAGLKTGRVRSSRLRRDSRRRLGQDPRTLRLKRCAENGQRASPAARLPTATRPGSQHSATAAALCDSPGGRVAGGSSLEQVKAAARGTETPPLSTQPGWHGTRCGWPMQGWGSGRLLSRVWCCIKPPRASWSEAAWIHIVCCATSFRGGEVGLDLHLDPHLDLRAEVVPQPP